MKICYTIFKPAGASRDHRVPLIMHSHGWGGSRTTDPEAFRPWLRRRLRVLSFDQRGFGESGGFAHVENPRFEGIDNVRLIRLVSRLPWVKQDGPGDPRLGAIGGSYGGGYQYLGAFKMLQRRGTPVYDALAPEITWNDLNESLAPDGVVRSEWAYALSAAAAPTDALPPRVYRALVEGSVTGEWPDGSGPTGVDLPHFFRRNGPRWHVDHGRRLDIPVLMGQGHTDTLFNLQQALDNWRTALTAGRAAPEHLRRLQRRPHAAGRPPAGHRRRLRPVQRAARRRQLRRAGPPVHGRAAQGPRPRPGRLRPLPPGHARQHLHHGRLGGRRHHPRGRARSRSPSGAGAPIAYEVAQGPIRIAGSAHFTGRLTAPGLQSRGFFGLGVGTSPADAAAGAEQRLPPRREAPVDGERRRVELPAVAVDVPEGQNLYLVASPVSDTFAGMSSRAPGAILFDDTVVHLPVVGR